MDFSRPANRSSPVDALGRAGIKRGGGVVSQENNAWTARLIEYWIVLRPVDYSSEVFDVLANCSTQ